MIQNCQKESNQRHQCLDVISGLFILFMVFHHCYYLIPNGNLLYNLLLPFFYFFMAWFFFKSGIVFNPKKDEPLGMLIKKRANRLLVPYALFSILGFSITILDFFLDGSLHKNIINYALETFIITGSLPGAGPLWYLLTLFFVYSFYLIVCRFLSRNYILIIILFWGFLAWFLDYCGYHTHLYLGNFCLGSFFFGFGYLYRKDSSLPIWALPILAFIFVGTWLFFPSLVSVLQNKTIKGSYIAWLIASISGILLYMEIARRWLNDSNFLSYIGRNTMSIYLWHTPIINILKLLFIVK